MATRSRQRQDVMFSELPLELKKQFLHHLAKNDVEFERSKDNRYVQAKVKLIEDEANVKKLSIPDRNSRSKSPGKSESLGKTNASRHFAKHSNKFHEGCVYSPWEQNRMSNNAKLREDLKRRIKHERHHKYDKNGNRVMTFEEIRDKLRSEPNQKKAIPKVERNYHKKSEMFPNEHVVEDPEDGIYFDNDIMDKDYYYRRLAERLGYSRVYNFSGSNYGFT